MDKYTHGTWESLWGCKKCRNFGELYQVGAVCGKCGADANLYTVRPVYEARRWLPNKHIGYETIGESREK